MVGCPNRGPAQKGRPDDSQAGPLESRPTFRALKAARRNTPNRLHAPIPSGRRANTYQPGPLPLAIILRALRLMFSSTLVCKSLERTHPFGVREALRALCLRRSRCLNIAARRAAQVKAVPGHRTPKRPFVHHHPRHPQNDDTTPKRRQPPIASLQDAVQNTNNQGRCPWLSSCQPFGLISRALHRHSTGARKHRTRGSWR